MKIEGNNIPCPKCGLKIPHSKVTARIVPARIVLILYCPKCKAPYTYRYTLDYSAYTILERR
jgi:hypothetical protein